MSLGVSHRNLIQHQCSLKLKKTEALTNMNKLSKQSHFADGENRTQDLPVTNYGHHPAKLFTAEHSSS